MSQHLKDKDRTTKFKALAASPLTGINVGLRLLFILLILLVVIYSFVVR